MYFPVILHEKTKILVRIVKERIAARRYNKRRVGMKIAQRRKLKGRLRFGLGIPAVQADIKSGLERMIPLDMTKRIQKLIYRAHSKLIELRGSDARNCGIGEKETEYRKRGWPAAHVRGVPVYSEGCLVYRIARENIVVRQLEQLNTQSTIRGLIRPHTVRGRCIRIIDIVSRRESAFLRLLPIYFDRTRIFPQFPILLDREEADIRTRGGLTWERKWRCRKRQSSHNRDQGGGYCGSKALRRCQRREKLSACLSHAFVICEEEHLVFGYWPADVTAELIQTKM